MPLLQIERKQLKLLKPANFKAEKELQQLIENNLETVFNCKMIATEFSTGSEHAGRIDSLALSEENNPVIIEYKKVESSELINQGLYYLAWLNDHRGDFDVLARKVLGSSIEIDWSAIRVICMAPGYKKFDLHAVKMTKANIELWQYRLFDQGLLYLEEVFRKNCQSTKDSNLAHDTYYSGMGYSFEQHLQNVEPNIQDIAHELRDFISGLNDSVEEVPKKFYIAYKSTQNFVCMEIQKRAIILYLKLDAEELGPLPVNARDVKNIGHLGTGDFELTITNAQEAQFAWTYIEMALQRVGG